MQPIKQALINTEDQICNLLDILDEDGTLAEYEQELDNLSQDFDDWIDRLNEELTRRELRKTIVERDRKIARELENVITQYENRMEDLGYATLESWKLLRNELDNRIEQSIKRMIRGTKI